MYLWVWVSAPLCLGILESFLERLSVSGFLLELHVQSAQVFPKCHFIPFGDFTSGFQCCSVWEVEVVLFLEA